MMTLDELSRQIDDARSPQDLFGDDIDGTLTKLRIVCHPDKHPGDARAEELFKRLGLLADEARKPPVEIKSPNRTYRLLKRIAIGDIADVFMADASGADAIVKISRINGAAAMIEQERSALKAILDRASASNYCHYFPALIDSFAARDKFQKRINVFRSEPGFFTLEQVRQRYPTGVDGRHQAWIFKRLLTAIGFAHQTGFVHGAVVPSHVMIHAKNHGLQLIGWGQSVRGSQRIRSISTQYKDWYPPEVIGANKRIAAPATDIYLAAKCLVYLAGGDPVSCIMPDGMPKQIRAFLRSCLMEGQSMRPSDAWELLDQFEELLRGLYGPPKFHELVMV